MPTIITDTTEINTNLTAKNIIPSEPNAGIMERSSYFRLPREFLPHTPDDSIVPGTLSDSNSFRAAQFVYVVNAPDGKFTPPTPTTFYNRVSIEFLKPDFVGVVPPIPDTVEKIMYIITYDTRESTETKQNCQIYRSVYYAPTHKIFSSYADDGNFSCVINAELSKLEELEKFFPRASDQTSSI